MSQRAAPQIPAQGARSSALFLALALLASFWVVLVNGGPLFHFDTTTYLKRGNEILTMLGLPDESQLHALEGQAVGAAPTGEGRNALTVDGSRSASYSLLFGLLARIQALELVLLLNGVTAILAIWLSVRVVLRGRGSQLSPAAVTAGAVLLASLGSLPFYVAYLMADILAPVLILMAATLAAFAGRMTFWEIVLAFVLGAGAAALHTSHLAIAILLVPLVLVAALVVRGPRRWLAPLVLLAIVGVAASEQIALRLAAGATGGTSGTEVVYRPFLTARLISDGPGSDYLDANCPDGKIPACALHEVLSRSDDPRRLAPSNIVFSRTPSLGSYLLLDDTDRRDVAATQFDFFFDVLRERPVQTLRAILGNTLKQAVLASVRETLQTDGFVAAAQDLKGLALGDFGHGRLTAWTGWVGTADLVQGMLYILSALTIILAVASPKVPRPLRVFLVMIVLGILVNAFVCGAISQPANRYGARVIWLLPVAAVIGGAVLAAQRRSDRAGIRSASRDLSTLGQRRSQ